MAFERDPKFYSELKQINEDILKLVETFHSKSPYYDYSATFQDYTKQLDELKKKFPVGDTIISNESQPDPITNSQPESTKNSQPDSGCDTGGAEGENDEPPKPNVEIFTEEGAKFEARCKLYKINRSEERGAASHQLLGCGTLFVKDLDSSKLHLIMRQDPDLRKVLFNHVITSSTPTKLLTKAIQLGVPCENGKMNMFVAKVKDDNIASELYRVLHPVGGEATPFVFGQ